MATGGVGKLIVGVPTCLDGFGAHPGLDALGQVLLGEVAVAAPSIGLHQAVFDHTNDGFAGLAAFVGGRAQEPVGIIYDFGNLYCLFHQNLFCHHIKSIAWKVGVVNNYFWF